jgi:hypothetical protein
MVGDDRVIIDLGPGVWLAILGINLPATRHMGGLCTRYIYTWRYAVVCVRGEGVTHRMLTPRAFVCAAPYMARRRRGGKKKAYSRTGGNFFFFFQLRFVGIVLVLCSLRMIITVRLMF